MTFPFPAFSPSVGAGSSGILDAFSPTGAWSASRDLLTAFAGGSRYTTVSSVVDSFKDQSGNSRNLDQATSGSRPAITTAGPNSRACLDFDGTNDFLGGAAISNFIAAGSGLVIVSCVIDTFNRSAANVYNNDALFCDGGAGYMGIYLKNAAGGTGYAYNWDGTEDSASATLSTATAYVLHWRHESGNIYFGVNGTESSPTASGNTQVITGPVRLGSGGGILEADVKVFEVATFSTVPSGANITTIINDMKTWIGA